MPPSSSSSSYLLPRQCVVDRLAVLSDHTAAPGRVCPHNTGEHVGNLRKPALADQRFTDRSSGD